MVPRLKERYRKEIVPTLMREFGYKNLMQVPRLEKVVVNIGVGEAIAEDVDVREFERLRASAQACRGGGHEQMLHDAHNSFLLRRRWFR